MIKNFIKPEAIFLKLESTTKDEALVEISKNFFEQGFVTDKNQFLQSLIYREELMNTSLTNGIAIPHGISSSVIKPVISIAISREGIDWNSDDLRPINIIFTLALPKGDKDLQIDALQMIALYANNDHFNKEIMKSKTKEDVINTFIKHYPETL